MLSQRGKAGTWYTRFTAPDGRRVFESCGTTDKRLAQEYEAQLKARLYREQRLGDTPAKSWPDAVVAWIAEHQGKATIEKDRANLRWLHPHLGGLMLPEVSPELLAELAAKRLAEPRDKRPGATSEARTSPATVNRMLALVRSILRFAHARGWLASVPPVPMLPEVQQDVVPLTREQVAALMAEAPEHLRAPMAFALATGLREQNVLRLEWSRVDLERRFAWIQGSATKGRRAIGVPLSSDAVAILEGQRGRSPRWCFPGPKGTPLSRASNSGWYGARRRSGVDARWHDLRHTWASWHAMEGTTLRDLMELGGWSGLAMVLRYSHLAASHLAAAADRIRVPLPETPSPKPQTKARRAG